MLIWQTLSGISAEKMETGTKRLAFYEHCLRLKPHNYATYNLLRPLHVWSWLMRGSAGYPK